MTYIESIKFLLGSKSKRILPLVTMFLLSSLIDLIGMGLIGGYIAIILDPLLTTKVQEILPIISFLNNLNHEETILFVGYGLFITFLVKFFLVIFANKIIYNFGYFEQAKIQKIMINGFLHQDYEAFILSKSAESLASISTYSSIYKDTLTLCLQGLSNILVIIAVFIMLAVISINTIALLVLVMVIIFYAYNLGFTRRLDAAGRAFTEGSANLIRGTQEAAEGIREIKTLGKEAFFIDSVSSSADQIAKGGVRLNIFTILPRGIMEVALIGFIVLIIAVNISLNKDLAGALSILSIFAAAMIRITPLISQLQAAANSIVFGRESIILLAKIMKDKGVDINVDLKTFKKNASSKSKDVFNQLKLENISYTYPNSSKPSIINVNLEINQGDFIGLIGPSGAGKTTLIDIILGFLKPSEGILKFNGADAHDDIKTWLYQCAYLPQEIFLINGTLKENITLSKDEFKSEELDEALKLSRLSAIAHDLPDGLDTSIGDRGVRLSGGQKQRVAIARAIFNKREVLLLDESTSALDSETEKAVIKEILTLRNEKTIIAIAHRVSTLKECNKIFRLNDGRIEGPFSYDEIASN